MHCQRRLNIDPQWVSFRSAATGSLTEQGRAVLRAVAAAELAPGQGAQLLSAIGVLARVIEIDELQVRIAALEDRHATH